MAAEVAHSSAITAGKAIYYGEIENVGGRIVYMG
jgi:hypothetical protein